MVIRLVEFKSALSDAEVLKRYAERAPRYRELAGQPRIEVMDLVHTLRDSGP